jgi:hypothetical protein
MSPITNKTANQFFKQGGSKVPLTIPMSQITGGQQHQQLNIKPALQQQQNFLQQQPKKFIKGPSSELHDISPTAVPHTGYHAQKGSVVLNFDSNRDHHGQVDHP